MLLRRPLAKTLTIFRRELSTAAAVSVDEEPIPLSGPPLTYLDGFPRPDARHAETLLAVPRADSGKYVARRERDAGRVPSIVFSQEDGQNGGNKRLVSVQSKQIFKLVNQLGRAFFLSRLFELEVWSKGDGSGDLIEKARVLPRLLHLHHANDKPLNVTFIRAPPSALLKVDVPIVFRGEDASPGLRKGAYLNVIKRTVKYLCPADIIPPYIDADMSELDMGQKLFMKDLKVHPALILLESPELPICSFIGSRGRDKKK